MHISAYWVTILLTYPFFLQVLVRSDGTVRRGARQCFMSSLLEFLCMPCACSLLYCKGVGPLVTLLFCSHVLCNTCVVSFEPHCILWTCISYRTCHYILWTHYLLVPLSCFMLLSLIFDFCIPIVWVQERWSKYVLTFLRQDNKRQMRSTMIVSVH